MPRAASGGFTEKWFGCTALADLLGADFSLADSHKLYACHNYLLEHKQALFDHLVSRWRDLFNASFEVLVYDLTAPISRASRRKMRTTSGALATAATSAVIACTYSSH